MAPTERRLQIIDAAEEIMCRKGQNESTISEIALRAGVTDSAIYHYFKNKEDLLFAIPGERMKEVLASLQDQLQGIRDPVSRLSKMIWFHLHYNQTHQEYATLLLVESHSNRNFYQHPAYDLIREYSRILWSILDDGVRAGMFREDVDIRIVRDSILGLLNWETLSCLAAHETERVDEHFEDIVSLLLPMISKQATQRSAETDKSTRILRAAEMVFAEKGYNQATISEISKLAKVAEGTVYEYFENKEHLLFSIPQDRFKQHIERLNEIFEIRTPMKKLRRFIRYHFFLYLTQRDFLKVFLLHIQLNKGFYQSQAYESFKRYAEIVYPILDEGKQDGSVRPEVNNRVFRNLFLGAFSHMALRWYILDQETRTDKMREIDEVVSLLCRAVATQKP
jgi:TetR/AcrR family transcriptional regulator, fatty acid metabolism regulator protein